MAMTTGSTLSTNVKQAPRSRPYWWTPEDAVALACEEYVAGRIDVWELEKRVAVALGVR
jgi:hypothetical protein